MLTLQHTLRHNDLPSGVGGEFRSERIQSSALYNTVCLVTDFTSCLAIWSGVLPATGSSILIATSLNTAV